MNRQKEKENIKNTNWTYKNCVSNFFFVKTLNWKSPGSVRIQATCSFVTKVLETIIEEPKQIPDWLTTGIKYHLSKSGDTKEPNNYPPIASLSTMYNMLTGINTRRISLRLEQHSLLLLEQKGCCCSGSKTFKCQLLISQTIFEDCRESRKI
jgi:hypothetical protein